MSGSNEIVLFQSDEAVRLKVLRDGDIVRLTPAQMFSCCLFFDKKNSRKIFPFALYAVLIIAFLMLLVACAPADLPEVRTSTPISEPSPIETTPTTTSTQSPTEAPPSPTSSPIEAPPSPTSSPIETPPSPTPLEPYIPIMPDTELLSETPLFVLEAYYEVLKTAVDEYGYGDGVNGVVFADFVDLDNDGIPELIFIYGNGNDDMDGEVAVRVYGYSGRLVLHTSYRLLPTHTNEVRKATCRNGLSFLTYSDVSGLDGFDKYYTVVNGAWTLALSLTWNTKAERFEELDIDVGSDMWEEFWHQFDDDPDMWLDFWNEYYVNGNLVNLDLYSNAPEMELGITSERTLWNWWGYMGNDYVYNGADDWRIDIAEYWNTVPIVITALESILKAASR